LIAFLRSDDPRVAAADIAPPDSQPSFLLKLLCHSSLEKLPYPKQRIEAPPLEDKRAYGRYLVAVLDCYSCHSSSFTTINILEPEKTPGYRAGGNRLLDPTGRPICSANITFDEDTGI
jgi:hypothetical protein